MTSRHDIAIRIAGVLFLTYFVTCWISIFIVGFADVVTLDEATKMESAGFLQGTLHGSFATVAWVISFFRDDVAIYAIYGNKAYQAGFGLGLSILFASLRFSRYLKGLRKENSARN